MRAVALSDKDVQKKVNKSFVPLKVIVPAGGKGFPLDWPALAGWRISYGVMKGDGFTGCSVIPPDLKVQYGSTGSALVWELFDSTAYDADKFNAMLDRGLERWAREMELRAAGDIRGLASFRRKVGWEVGEEGKFRLPPKGFSTQKAIELFTMTGDYPKKD